MSIVTDEQLMAFADGALPDDEARALEIMLAEDPALEARLEPFLVTGARLAAVFEGPLRAPIPDRLIAAVTSAPRAGQPMQVAARTATARESFAERLWRALVGTDGRLTAAAYASVLAVAGAAGWLVVQQPQTIDVAAIKPGTIADGAFKAALEVDVSSNAPRPGMVTPVMTLPGRDGQSVCRQYRMDGGANGWFGGLACRGADGSWRVAAHVKAAATGVGSGGYVSAGSEELPEVEKATDALTKGDALDVETEKTLIAQGWRPRAP